MAARQPKTETMKLTEARQHFSQVLNLVYRTHDRVLVEKSGIPVAAIVSTDDLRRLDELEAGRHTRFAAMSEVSRTFADVPIADLEAATERAVAEHQAEDVVEPDAVVAR